jgi:spermidine synthase
MSRKVRREATQVRRAAAAETAAVDAPVRYFTLLAFFSGCAALIYEVLWVRQLGIIVGVDVYAVSAGISTFFAGLALGSFVFGRRSDRAQRPLHFYALLELAISFSGTLATLALSRVAPLFVAIQRASGPLAWLLVVALVGFPAFLIGGTLPLLFRAWSPQSRVAKGGGILYAANTAGGIAGALLTPFLLIPSFGIRGASFFAAGTNIAVALAAFALSRRLQPAAKTANEPARHASPNPQTRLAILLYGVAGGIALGYEVIWSQAIVPFLSTRSFAFAIVLATYLAGLMAGSAIYSRSADRLKNPWTTFALLISGAGVLALFLVAGLGQWLLVLQTQAEVFAVSLSGSILLGMCARFIVAAFSVVFLPTVLLGAAFPVALRLAVDPLRIGHDVGELLAFNTFGGILGTLLTGFAFVPALGLIRTLALLAVLASLVATLAIFRSPAAKRSPASYLVFASGATALLCFFLIPANRLAQSLVVVRGGGEVVFYRENAAGTVAVLQEPKANFRRLYIQGVSNSGDAMPSLRYMRLQALLPLLILEQEPKSALVIGYGTGITTGSLLAVDSLDRRVCVELLPGVVEASHLFRGNFGAANDSRIEVRIADGRRELLRSPERYDLITLEPPPPSAAGVANLYSTNFYQLASQRLTNGGMLAQWLPLGAQNEDDSRAIVRSFLDVFPYATLWSTELHETLLVGSNKPIILDADRIARRFHQPKTEAALYEVGINSPAALLATYLTDRAGLEKFASDAAPVTDDRPSIEYTTWVRPGEVARVLPDLLALRTEPQLQNVDDAFFSSLTAEERHLHDFYDAGLAAYRGERELWAKSIQQVLAGDSRNPYYLWTIGGSK